MGCTKDGEDIEIDHCLPSPCFVTPNLESKVDYTFPQDPPSTPVPAAVRDASLSDFHEQSVVPLLS